MRTMTIYALPALLLTGCGDTEKPQETNAEEVITTVALSLSPSSGGAAIEARWADPENDGDPVIDPITLTDGETYTLSVGFLNELEDPAEDITVEVDAESDQHQVFFTGSAVTGPAAGINTSAVVEQIYADTDLNGLPVGLENDLVTLGAGSGSLIVTLRHLPPESDTATKVEGLAEQVASGGIDSIPGSTDASVEFSLTVQ